MRWQKGSWHWPARSISSTQIAWALWGVLAFGTTAARVVRDAFFLAHLSPAHLPWLFAAAAIVWLLAVSLVENRSGVRSIAGLVDLGIWAGIAGSVACLGLFLAAPRFVHAVWLVYLVVEACCALACMAGRHCLQRFSDETHPRDGASLSGLVGTFLGALAAFHLIGPFGAVGVFLCWSASLGAVFILFQFLVDREEGLERVPDSRTTVALQAWAAPGVPAHARGAVWTAMAICGCFAVGGVWIEFEFLRRGAALFGQEYRALGHFIAAVVASAALLGIPAHLLADMGATRGPGGRTPGVVRAALLGAAGLANALLNGIWAGAGTRALWVSADAAFETPMTRRLEAMLGRPADEQYRRMRSRFVPVFVVLGAAGLGFILPFGPENAPGLGVLLLSALCLALLWRAQSCLVSKLFPSLVCQDGQERSRALNGVLRLPDDTAVATIIRAADCVDADVRLSLLKAVFEHDGAVARAVADSSASSLDLRIRSAAVSFLSRAGTEKELPVLVERLGDGSAEVCVPAAMGCARLLREKAAKPLERLQFHSDGKVRASRHLALAKWAGEAGRPATREFAALLKTGTKEESCLCVSLLMEEPSEQFLGELLEIGRDRDRSPDLREASLRVLASWGRIEAAEALLDMVRQWPGNALAASTLKDLLPGHPGILARTLGADEEPSQVRMALLEAVSPPVPQEVLAACFQCCSDPRPDVRYAAVRALRRAESPETGAERRADWQRVLAGEMARTTEWAESFVALEGGPEGLRGLRSILQDEFGSSREILVEAVGGFLGEKGSSAQFLGTEDAGRPLSSHRKVILERKCGKELAERLLPLLAAESPEQVLAGSLSGGNGNGRGGTAGTQANGSWTAVLNRLRFAPAPPIVHVAANQALQEVVSSTQSPGPHRDGGAPANRTLESVFLLKQASIFKGLHVEDLEVLAAFAGQQELEVGRAFVQQGERLDRLAVVSQGKLVNCRRSNGQLEPVESIGPGSCLGGTCLSGGEPSRFTMLAHSYTKLLTLERPALERAMALRPAIRRALNGTT